MSVTPKDQLIRQERMGILRIHTRPGARVRVKQKRHAFSFGTAISSRVLGGQISRADRDQYLVTVKANFNCAVHENALKWYSTETKAGEVDYGDADRILDWCEANDIPMRGHCLFWSVEQYVQDWLKALDTDALRQAVERRARDVARRFHGRITEHDLNNEMLHGSYYRDRLGPGIIKEMTTWARDENPDLIFYVNDYNILSGKELDRYVAQIEDFLNQGIPVGGIGVQGHFHGEIPLDAVATSLDRLAQFNLPIKVTEFDMKTLDEEAKAQGLRDFFKLCFAHKAVSGILLWGFWAGRHWLTSEKYGIEGFTGLWNNNWEPMPQAHAYRDLVFGNWWTDVEVEADVAGECSVPVFLGTHEVRAGGVTQEVSLLHKEIEVILRL